MKILVVEDSDRLRNALREGLQRSGFVVDVAGDGRTGLHYAVSAEYDVVVLDIMMPRLDGFGFLDGLRDRKSPAKVLVLSARDQVDDRVKGLEAGADDYLTKPFAFEELVARIKTLARRRVVDNGPVLDLGDIVVDTVRRRVTANGVEVHLTASEFNLVEYLSARRGAVVSKNRLREAVSDATSDAVSNTVEVLVSNVRRKLRESGVDDVIKTRRSFGYYIE